MATRSYTTFLFLLVQGALLAQTFELQEPRWIVGGAFRSVHAMAADTANGLLYIGGSFEMVGPRTPDCAWVDRNTGAALPDAPTIDGLVYASVPDGSGGAYIGGNFSSVNGTPRMNLARLNADGSLHPWQADVDGAVYTISAGGGAVYIGGDFENVQDLPRANIAAVDALTGTVNNWDPGAQGLVRALVLASDTVYAGGYFITMGGSARQGLAAVHAGTGAVLPFVCNVMGGVLSLAKSGNDLFVGGSFTQLQGTTHQNIARVSAATGVPYALPLLKAGSDVNVLRIADGRLYAGGLFNSLNNTDRFHAGSFDLSTYALTSWDPSVEIETSGLVNDLVVTGDTVLMVGQFDRVGGVKHYNMAVVHAVTGAVMDHPAVADNTVRSVGLLGPGFLVSGVFSSVGVVRDNMACMDLATGAALPWAPSVTSENGSGGVFAIALSDTSVYIGGRFDAVGGAPRSNFAELGRTNAQPTPFAPSANSTVLDMVLYNNALYVAGDFSFVNGAERRLAKLNASTGATMAFPNTNANVNAMVRVGDTLYVGGSFSNIGNVGRNFLAAVNLQTNTTTAWNTSCNGTVNALALHNGRLYVGGNFSTISSQARAHAAAIALPGAALTAWAPESNSAVDDYAFAGNVAFACGGFNTIGGTPASRLAALDATTGASLNWDPQVLTDAVTNLLVTPGLLHVAGKFWGIDGQTDRTAIAAYGLADCDGTVGGPAWPGLGCDDGDVLTVNDAWTMECACLGETPTGLPAVRSGATLSVAPVPTDGPLRVEGCPANAHYSVQDATGKEILHGNVSGGALDISSLAPGAYAIRLSEQGGKTIGVVRVVRQ